MGNRAWLRRFLLFLILAIKYKLRSPSSQFSLTFNEKPGKIALVFCYHDKPTIIPTKIMQPYDYLKKEIAVSPDTP